MSDFISKARFARAALTGDEFYKLVQKHVASLHEDSILSQKESLLLWRAVKRSITDRCHALKVLNKAFVSYVRFSQSSNKTSTREYANNLRSEGEKIIAWAERAKQKMGDGCRTLKDVMAADVSRYTIDLNSGPIFDTRQNRQWLSEAKVRTASLYEDARRAMSKVPEELQSSVGPESLQGLLVAQSVAKFKNDILDDRQGALNELRWIFTDYSGSALLPGGCRVNVGEWGQVRERLDTGYSSCDSLDEEWDSLVRALHDDYEHYKAAQDKETVDELDDCIVICPIYDHRKDSPKGHTNTFKARLAEGANRFEEMFTLAVSSVKDSPRIDLTFLLALAAARSFVKEKVKQWNAGADFIQQEQIKVRASGEIQLRVIEDELQKDGTRLSNC